MMTKMSNERTGGLFILFGASGDLAKRFILPALHQLYQRDKLSKDFAIMGTSNREYTEDEFKELVEESVKGGPNYEDFSSDFLDLIYYHTMDNTQLQDYGDLHNKIDDIVEEHSLERNFLYYYSISPSLFSETTTNLKQSGIVDKDQGDDHRVIVEKPFGEDLETSKEYHDILLETFTDDQIYFNDHFSAMDMSQNILATRYFNPFIDGVLNAEYIENVQISLPEKLSVGDRGEFYDEYGASLDMFQNHILQLLTLVAMDLPEDISAEAVHDKKIDVLKNIPTLSKEEVEENVVRGQYQADHSRKYNNYRDEPDVPDDSNTDTYFAAKIDVAIDRWKDVPFYVRTGKALAEDFFAVDYVLKSSEGVNNDIPQRITFNIEPKTGLSVVLSQKGTKNDFDVRTTNLHTVQEESKDLYVPDPFENIIEDAMRGERMLFTTFSEIKEQWRIADSIMEAWAEMPDPDFPNYRANTFGPRAADELPEKNGHEWIYRLDN